MDKNSSNNFPPKKVLLLRTYQDVGVGGAVPSLELLYLASMIMQLFKNRYEVKILDTGIGTLSLDEIKTELEEFNPGIIFFNSLIWEADFLHKITSISKNINRRVTTLVEGQLATLVKKYLLKDKNIDYVIIGEPEITGVELLSALETESDLSRINGIAFRENGEIVLNKPREYIKNLDDISISSSAWDLIDIKEYAKYLSWNGSTKERFYVPVLTSRGCPFNCTFCCESELLGKRFRARSAENVFSEMLFLYKKYGVKEIHIFDSVFNCDVERAERICNLIIDSGIDFSLAFPHGIRADIMTEELITLLRKAGTYKLVYGIETANPRLQEKIGKNLNIKHLKDIINKTAKSGIIVGGYFMLGFPTETYDEMLQTVDFALNSDLNLAYFFKVTRFDDIVEIYKSFLDPITDFTEARYNSKDISYFSTKRSYAEVSTSELNNIILYAQQKFYLNGKRIWRNLLKFPHKTTYLKNLCGASSLILQSYLMKKLQNSKNQ